MPGHQYCIAVTRRSRRRRRRHNRHPFTDLTSFEVRQLRRNTVREDPLISVSFHVSFHAAIETPRRSSGRSLGLHLVFFLFSFLAFSRRKSLMFPFDSIDLIDPRLQWSRRNHYQEEKKTHSLDRRNSRNIFPDLLFSNFSNASERTSVCLPACSPDSRINK